MAEFVLEASSLRATVVPACAGRVATLSYAGRQLFVGPDIHADNWGSTYWTSPQADWGWPPLGAIDHAPFEVLSESPLHLRGPVADLAGTRVRLDKEFTAVPEQEAIDVVYTLENVGSARVRVAGWEISRVAAGGLTFYPTGEAELSPVPPHGLLVLHKEHGHSFYHHTEFVLGQSIKVHADGADGYLAHVTAPAEDGTRLLFLKLFSDSSSAEQAPGEGEVEIFANEDGLYVEVEVQSRCEELLPGQKQRFGVRWAVRPLPPGLAVYPGSLALIEFTRALASALR